MEKRPITLSAFLLGIINDYTVYPGYYLRSGFSLYILALEGLL